MKKYKYKNKFWKYEKKYLCKAHHYSNYHRGALESLSTHCFCFYCKNKFTIDDIKEWVDLEETALCPCCGIDSVLGNKNPFSADFPIDDPEFVDEMNTFWFDISE
jgi:hypothetical protein